MRRQTFLPLCISFLSAVAIFVQYKYSNHPLVVAKTVRKSQHPILNSKTSKDIESSVLKKVS